MVLSDKVLCNNGKVYHCIVGYQIDGALIPLFIKTPKNIFSYGVSQCDKNSAYTMSFNVSETKEWVPQYEKIWNELELQLFEKLTTEPIKGERKFVHGKKTFKLYGLFLGTAFNCLKARATSRRQFTFYH